MVTDESITRYYGRYSSRRRGERAKLAAHCAQGLESKPERDYRSEFRKSAWVACIKRTCEIDPFECPKCKAQMRIIAFIQDEHSIKDIMWAEDLPDFIHPKNEGKTIQIACYNTSPRLTPSAPSSPQPEPNAPGLKRPNDFHPLNALPRGE